MTVNELILELQELDKNKEIRYDSYEFLGDFIIESIDKKEYQGVSYYCIKGCS